MTAKALHLNVKAPDAATIVDLLDCAESSPVTSYHMPLTPSLVEQVLTLYSALKVANADTISATSLEGDWMTVDGDSIYLDGRSLTVNEDGTFSFSALVQLTDERYTTETMTISGLKTAMIEAAA